MAGQMAGQLNFVISGHLPGHFSAILGPLREMLAGLREMLAGHFAAILDLGPFPNL